MIDLKNLKNIPEELRQLLHWTLQKEKAPLKLNGELASINKPEDWASLEKLKEFLHDNLDQSKIKFNGIGFVFKPDLNLVFIDFDHVIDDQGNIVPEVERIVEKLDFHTEIFQSKPGVRL